MRSLTLLSINIAVVFLVTATVAVADVPQVINYQGRLTDSLGAAVDTTVQMVFTIYDGGNVVKWSETHPSVTVTNGLFNVLLGSTGGLNDMVFNDTSRFLGITVGGDPEILPRTRLVTAPYGMRVSTVDGASGGKITSDVEVPEIRLGNPVQNGELQLYMAGSAFPTIGAFDYPGDGGAINFFDETGMNTGAFEPDWDGEGGFFWVNGNEGYFQIEGDPFGADDSPIMWVIGAVSSVTVNTNDSGNASVWLPDDAVSSVEIMNESGIAQGRITGNVEITGETSMIDVVTVTIDIPAPGYVVVEASAQARFSNTTSSNYMACQIDKTAGGGTSAAYYYFAGFSSPPNTGTTWMPVSMRRTYYESTAASYTYRFEAEDYTENGTKGMWNPVITATYIPTSYGTVTALASAPEATQFESAQLVTVGSNGPSQQRTAEAGYVVDLRELELKALKARAVAAEAERDLLEAQRQQQGAGRQGQR